MNDTLIFLVLAGLALIFKWLTSQGSTSDGEKRGAAPPNERPAQRPPPESEEERVRRFLEALGMPQGTAPPPRVERRQVVTPAPRAEKPKVKRSWVQPLPPIVTTPPEILPPPLPSEPPAPVVVQREEVIIPPAPLPARVLPKPMLRGSAPVASLGQMLRSRTSIRQAIILREVLGSPRGLQAFDELRSF